MRVDELDDQPADQGAAALRSCADIDRWVDGLVAAVASAAAWTDAEVEAALADHPRIGTP